MFIKSEHTKLDLFSCVLNFFITFSAVWWGAFTQLHTLLQLAACGVAQEDLLSDWLLPLKPRKCHVWTCAELEHLSGGGGAESSPFGRHGSQKAVK